MYIINSLDFFGNSKCRCEKFNCMLLLQAPPGKVLHPDVGLMPKTSERTRGGAVLSG